MSFRMLSDDHEVAQTYPHCGWVRLTTFQGPRGRAVMASTNARGELTFWNEKGQTPPAKVRDELRRILA